jgi:hypothetical protein
MRRRDVVLALAASFAAASFHVLAAPALPRVQVFKSPLCGCCEAWVDHMKASGFGVDVAEVDDPGVDRRRLGMPDAFGSCHTATVGGYVIEGHVPATDVKKLLGAKPTALGLAVPGMPQGSPGMEFGSRNDPYDVLLIDSHGRKTVFSHYPGS